MYGISPKLPLLVDDLDGHYGLTKTLKEAIKQNFKNLMLTSPGERVMDKDFGVGLRHYLFENFTMELGDRIEFNIYQQTKKYLSFIKITHVDIKQKEDALSTLNIRIEYTIPKLGTNDVLILNQTN